MEIDMQNKPRQLALAMRSQMVLSAEDEEVLWWVLQRHAVASCAYAGAAADEGDNGAAAEAEPCLNYDEFTQVAGECREAIGPAADLYFQASTFLRLARDEGGRVPAGALFRYCLARSAQIQLRAELGVLDAAGSGALLPAQLEQWLLRHVPLAALTEQLVSEADWCTAVAARLLLLHGRRGRLSVKDVTASPHMNELSAALHALEAAEAAATAAAAACDGSNGGSGGEGADGACSPASARSGLSQGASAAAAAQLAAAQQRLQGSWFSPAGAATLRARFAELDADGDGLLSELEFANFSQGTMTRLAIQRLFAQHCGTSSSFGSSGRAAAFGERAGRTGTGSPGMDFPAFCTFCAAWEQRHHPAAVRYFFPVLDLCGCGYLTQADLYTFFREIYALWVALGQYAELRVEDVLAEVEDLLRAPDPQHITPADFQRCGAAGTIIGLLLDVNLFWEYENREALLQQQQAAAGPA
ncbi:hypothetical protein ABPG75_002975 [Micractinium tetrahymenae]